jgi:hypothetical protein
MGSEGTYRGARAASSCMPALLPCERLALLGAVQRRRAAATLVDNILCVEFVALEELVSQSHSKVFSTYLDILARRSPSRRDCLHHNKMCYA